ncbi:hypothetical protein [Bacillus sp. 37MA]|uniref:hypothetical protein n=1 Tax=Bacillus sp. 37MA TaxID=1132442 RepID=UPI000362D1CB|nr:hypothetical protein [Bacillus sp. 37MA]
MTITTKDLKASKTMVENLLKVNGEKYNDWLQMKHQEYIEENQNLIIKALSAFKSSPETNNDEENVNLEDDQNEEVNSEERSVSVIEQISAR